MSDLTEIPEYLQWLHPTNAQMRDLCISGDGGRDEFKFVQSISSLQTRLKFVVDLLRLAIDKPDEFNADYARAICDEVSK